ncbi:MAG: hypothetical protein II717_01070, partial [Lachnospiraceae bacterium]|nr:hypothetical protein [Lachnospiraceae bacterium]
AEKKEAADTAAANVVVDAFNALPTEVTVNDKDAIEAARAAYNALTADQQALINADTLAILTNAETALAAAEQAAADQAAADAVVALIDAIGTVEYTDACKDKIDAARAAYDALTADQQALVNNYSTLTEAKTEYDELKGDADIALANLLRIRNATASVNGTTITLTPEDETATASMVCKLWDRTDVEFSNLDGATISKGGSLYADKYATATATIGGVEYTVVFNYEVIEFVLTPDLLKITNAEAAVDGTTITLTPVDESKQVNLYPKLKDGSEVVFSGISGLATTSKAGTLYAKGVASAKATINGVEYTVVFNYTPPTVDELIQVTGADVSVEGTTITLTATSGKVCFYSSLKDGSKATYSKSTITEGLNVTSTVSKSGTLYAIGDASAVVTIGGVEYTVNFVF